MTNDDNKNNAIAIARVEVQLVNVKEVLDDIRVVLRTELSALRGDFDHLKSRVTALELEQVQQKSAMDATARTGKLFWSGVVGVAGVAAWVVQLMASKLGLG